MSLNFVLIPTSPEPGTSHYMTSLISGVITRGKQNALGDIIKVVRSSENSKRKGFIRNVRLSEVIV